MFYKTEDSFLGIIKKATGYSGIFEYDFQQIMSNLDYVPASVNSLIAEVDDVFSSGYVGLERASKELLLKRRIFNLVMELRNGYSNVAHLMEMYPYMLFSGVSRTKMNGWNDEFAQSLKKVKKAHLSFEMRCGDGGLGFGKRFESDAARSESDVILCLFEEAKRKEEERLRAEKLLDTMDRAYFDNSIEDFLLLLEVLVEGYSRSIDNAVALEKDVFDRFSYFYGICIQFEIEGIELELQKIMDDEYRRLGFFNAEMMGVYLKGVMKSLEDNAIHKIRQECVDDESFYRMIYHNDRVNRVDYREYRKKLLLSSYLKEWVKNNVNEASLSDVPMTVKKKKNSLFVSDEAKERAFDLVRRCVPNVDKSNGSYYYAVLIMKLKHEELIKLKRSGEPNVSGVWKEIAHLTGDNPIGAKCIQNNIGALMTCCIKDLYECNSDDISIATKKWGDKARVVNKLWECKQQMDLFLNTDNNPVSATQLAASAVC